MNTEPIVIERTFQASSEKVWKGITDKDLMKKWYFDLAEFKPEVGFEFQFEGGTEEKTYVHLCRVTEVIEGKKLAHSWRYKGYKGDTIVSWELFEQGNETRVKLTHEGLETFPEDNPDFAKQNFVQGWTEIVGSSLKDFVEKDFVKRTIEISAEASAVWEVLINPASTKVWANEFSEGAYVETDWNKGSSVIWKDKEGNIGAKGVVKQHEKPSLLKVSFMIM